ncbi:metallo-mystery pair system four-Cys motif protein [Aliiglaciecola sp. CAU 1673]|uniref:MbnP family copper-binding protein n=1 Tax=Aliiglaciecola sp. CAU 1673 TaxID=3032595 RepID=UPI0023DA87F1|nr:MbnP family copper-binding protein [Aliiglaciecola sp. CAU 1673]MDF2177436.1 metallo-mystery pair system four-Cys motif protein [Aliiglaciecola sp. CAU 1673]
MKIKSLANIAALRVYSKSLVRLCVGWGGILVLAGCGFLSQKPQLQVELYMGGKPIPCGSALPMAGNWYLEHVKFYVSDLRDQNNNPLPFAVNNWQTEQSALISMEWNECVNASEQMGHHRLQLNPGLDLSAVEQLSFSLGLPYTTNHQDPLSQPSPLNLSSMFWTWQTGHKFMRLQLKSVSDSWAFHLGSTGCDSASKVRPPEQPCQSPNLFEVSLKRPKGQASTLVLHLDRLMAGITPARQNSCTFHPGETTSCDRLLENLGGAVFEWR